MHTLQKSLNSQPIKHIQVRQPCLLCNVPMDCSGKEPLIHSLCCMYSLKGGFLGVEHIEKLKEWIVELIPDDFDTSMFQ